MKKFILAAILALAASIAQARTPFTCHINSQAASLLECRAAQAGMKIYIQGIIVQTTTTTSGTYSLQSGTGTNCGTGTTAVFPSTNVAHRWNAPITSQAAAVIVFPFPLVTTAGHALCLIGTATNTISATIFGYQGQ